MAVADQRGGARVVTSVEDFDETRLARLGRCVLELEAAHAPADLAHFAGCVVAAFLAREAQPSENGSRKRRGD